MSVEPAQIYDCLYRVPNAASTKPAVAHLLGDLLPLLGDLALQQHALLLELRLLCLLGLDLWHKSVQMFRVQWEP